VFEILAIGNKPDVSATACKKVVENLGSSSPVKDLFYALKVNGILKCKVNADVFKVILFYGYLFMIRLRLNVMFYEFYIVLLNCQSEN